MRVLIGGVLWVARVVMVTMIILLMMIFLAPFVLQIQYTVVLTGSMVPTLPVGSLIFVREVDPRALKKGDIITFLAGPGSETRITHRIIEVTTDDQGQRLFRTKGDANDAEDRSLIPEKYVVGKVVHSIPGVGKARDFMRTRLGMIWLTVIPGVLVIINEAWSYWRAADPRRRALDRRKRRIQFQW